MKSQNQYGLHLRFCKLPPFYIIHTGQDRAHNEDSGYNSELTSSVRLPGSKYNPIMALGEKRFVDSIHIFRVPKILSTSVTPQG